ncbi:Nucleotide-binding universal stress protein, UspA family [Paenibacillus catalpae]|uniref:Universal stress protein n=1 Tax=Paenibacillus catalpae TaxID=1045775 RepID=A0A1I1WST0_9BACL|nr:universal stress protein [Paenibacillus catalpae]SFD98244.1 Nucleotide-binding universal stress protein, UspA family [Paenibacillus catalpae]
MYNHILIPVDGSQKANKALDHAIQLVKSMGRDIPLSVIHITDRIAMNEAFVYVDVGEMLDKEENEILSTAAEQLKASGVSYTLLRANGDPATMISRTAKERGVDLIIMGSRGVGLVSEILLGSVSHGVSQHAHCPVLIVK